MGLDKKRYKRLGGTRWVEHRIAALESHLHNLPILIGFCDQQIKQPHNQTMKKIVPILEGVCKNIASTKSLLFNSMKLDILKLLQQPMSKILHDVTAFSYLYYKLQSHHAECKTDEKLFMTVSYFIILA